MDGCEECGGGGCEGKGWKYMMENKGWNRSFEAWDLRIGVVRGERVVWSEGWGGGY